MNQGPWSPLLVEVILAGVGRVSGTTEQVAERRRLVDVLNSPEEVFELQSAQLTPAPGAQPRDFGSLTIEKRAILAAIPMETEQQAHRRALLTTVVGRTATIRAPLTLLVPPLTIEGVAHVAPGMGKLRANPNMFARFFPLTNAKVVFADGSVIDELPVLLVNREAVAAMSLRPEPLPAAKTPLLPQDDQTLTDEDQPLLKVVRPPRPEATA